MGILATLEHQQPDVVHLFWGHYPCIVGFLVLRALPRPVLSLFLGAYDLTRPFGASSWVAKRADLVSTHARWNFPVIEALGVHRERDPSGVSRDENWQVFAEACAREFARRIISVGRLECEKGVYDVLRIFAAIHDRWPDATLRLLGDGPEPDATCSISATSFTLSRPSHSSAM